ncbi:MULTISPECIES: hypothetical protein [unclassified Arthrobacter]|uniref:hypothetical protein n=1 Tax=unclassified Arthrobacter TaxID=235627 RepID=UPI0021076F63|nr:MULTISPECIES: hypothetical protein [unclassified Arthrobacter]MCQ1947486.1 hypothetical protein [Arthrobacter sp. zg-Y1116]MCQ1987438.1 hypothetical protein [Arthrobacter sp. zg-Y844]MCQ1996782.1 hypothetical protein [Arthrobacter sp. zg-Y1171]UWX82376.1 hypothetical protein N2L00_02780 [Arthrobacter sp. zg-Y1171]
MGKTAAQRAAKHGLQAGQPRPGGPGPAGMPAGPQGKSSPGLLVIAGVVATLFLFWYLHLMVPGQLSQLADGLSMPDSMVFGYGEDHLAALRSAMDEEALGRLSYVHKTAGTLFPLIFGLTWLLIIGLNTQRRALRWVLFSAPILFVVADLWENIAIDNALGAVELSSGDAALAGTLTVARWILLGLSLVASVVSVFTRGVGRPPELVAEDKG